MGITLGDPSGIGPEIVTAALARPAVRRALVPVVFGDASSLEGVRGLVRCTPESLRRPSGGTTLCAVSQLPPKERRPGRPTVAGGRAQLAYLRRAIEAAQAGVVDGLCTAPVSKEQISRTGVPFMGHTEVLAQAFGREVVMLMDGPRVKVALASTHLALRDVPASLSVEGLLRTLEIISRSLRPQLGRVPRIAVCGLNPHAGEGGLLGREEVEVISPAIARARKKRMDVSGPFAADGLFARAGRMPFDAVLAMYHDQGLVAAKALDFERTVNVTLGLPVPRTSPDHGVAYDIAGTGKADALPMVTALLKVAEMARAAA